VKTLHQKYSYTIDEHPNPESVYSWIRDNWHDLAQHVVDEYIDALKALADHCQGRLDYCISAVPDRGEYIRLTEYSKARLDELNADDCPLTGCYIDCVVIEGLRKGELEQATLASIHSETEYIYSDDGLRESLEAYWSEYEFFEDGSIA